MGNWIKIEIICEANLVVILKFSPSNLACPSITKQVKLLDLPRSTGLRLLSQFYKKEIFGKEYII